jgi:cytochrome c oxidase subunit 2
MILGDIARKRLHFLTLVIAGLATFATPQLALAAAAPAAPTAVVASPDVAATPAATDTAATAATAAAAPAGEGYTPLGPEWIRGQPVSGAFGFQPQYSVLGEQALWMHDVILMPIITFICVLVLGLLLWVIVRYNRRANPVPSKTSHNTLIEVIWTLVPVLILGVIAFPSINLLSKQFESAPKDALTIEKKGIYYGQCMELCGARHGYMPIVIEALPRPEFEAWVRSKGGTLPGEAAAAAPAQEPAPAVEGAPAAPAGGEPAPAAAAPAA